MWKKLMFGIIIGVMLMAVSTGVIYGAQINPASQVANSSSVIAGNGKGDGNGANQNGAGVCGGTGDCINENGTNAGNGAGNGNGNCTNKNCSGDCDGTGGGTGNCTNKNCSGDCDGTGDCTNENCTGDCNDGLIKQNGQQKNSNVNGVGAENKKAGSGCAASNQNKNVERYAEAFSFRNTFARFLSFFKFGNNS